MSATLELEGLRQRADHTHKFNAGTGRHGWLRLTPAYSVKIVTEIIVGHGQARRIYDPFCGTGTTALSAAYHGREGVTTDINPFLIWLATAKTACYSAREIGAAEEACRYALDLVRRGAVEPTTPPPIHNIERWWTPQTLDFLWLLRAAITAATEDESAARTLRLIAFCRSLIGLSNAAFDHQSMSFKDDEQLAFDFDILRDAGFDRTALRRDADGARI